MIIQGRTFPVKQIIVLATSLPRPVELTQEFFDRISHYYETRKSRNWTSTSSNKFRIIEKKHKQFSDRKKSSRSYKVIMPVNYYQILIIVVQKGQLLV